MDSQLTILKRDARGRVRSTAGGLCQAGQESGGQPARTAQLLHAPHQQHDERGLQQRDPADQGVRTKLSQLRELPPSHPVLLRQT